jgi:hypothetical protein
LTHTYNVGVMLPVDSRIFGFHPHTYKRVKVSWR